MIVNYYVYDDVKQTGEEDFELQDVLHHYIFNSIENFVFIYSEAHGGWLIDEAETYPSSYFKEEDIKISDLSYQLLIREVFEGKI